MDIRLTSAEQQHCWMDQGLLMPMQAVPTWAPSADKVDHVHIKQSIVCHLPDKLHQQPSASIAKCKRAMHKEAAKHTVWVVSVHPVPRFVQSMYSMTMAANDSLFWPCPSEGAMFSLHKAHSQAFWCADDEAP